jgi:8-oxo-dGTP pyrophosphatase MutT (NUDIX family)
MTGDGDGWVQCAAGHRHWGRFGAAGLLISDGKRAILQHRAPWTHEGDRWGLPGGARDSHEDATSTALREAHEEAEIEADLVEPLALSVDDHGGWSYTTVLSRPSGLIVPHAANAESTDVTWWGHADIEGLPLHAGLAAAWPRLESAPAPLLVLVDVRANTRFQALLGTDRARLDRLVRRGIPVEVLPDSRNGAGLSTLLPRFVVFDTAGTGATELRVPGDQPPSGWWQRRVTALPAGPDGAIESVDSGHPGDMQPQVVLVTESTDTARRFVARDGRASAVGADWLLGQLDRYSSD